MHRSPLYYPIRMSPLNSSEPNPICSMCTSNVVTDTEILNDNAHRINGPKEGGRATRGRAQPPVRVGAAVISPGAAATFDTAPQMQTLPSVAAPLCHLDGAVIAAPSALRRSSWSDGTAALVEIIRGEKQAGQNGRGRWTPNAPPKPLNFLAKRGN